MASPSRFPFLFNFLPPLLLLFRFFVQSFRFFSHWSLLFLLVRRSSIIAGQSDGGEDRIRNVNFFQSSTSISCNSIGKKKPPFSTAEMRLSWVLKLPAGENRPLPFILTLIPPLISSLLDPEIFFKSLDLAGTYGVLMLFGIIPAAMSWSDRYMKSPPSVKLLEVVPGGRFTLALVIGGAGWVIFSELLENLGYL